MGIDVVNKPRGDGRTLLTILVIDPLPQYLEEEKKGESAAGKTGGQVAILNIKKPPVALKKTKKPAGSKLQQEASGNFELTLPYLFLPAPTYTLLLSYHYKDSHHLFLPATTSFSTQRNQIPPPHGIVSFSLPTHL